MSIQNCWYLCTQNVPQIRCINCNIRTSCLSQFSLISILLNINKASKHCDCRWTITNAYGQRIEKNEFSKLPLSDPTKLGLIPLFSWNINQCCPVPWNIIGCSLGPQKTLVARFTVRAGNMGRNKAPYEKVPDSLAYLVRPTSGHGMVIFT